MEAAVEESVPHRSFSVVKLKYGGLHYTMGMNVNSSRKTRYAAVDVENFYHGRQIQTQYKNKIRFIELQVSQ